MSLSTPINMIRRGDNNGDNNGNNSGMDTHFGQSNSDSQLVEDILKEMGDAPGAEQQSNINSQSFQYAMDSSQVPAYKYNGSQNNDNNNYNNSYAEKMIHQQNNLGILSQIGINLSGASVKDKIIKNIKYPALVFVLCFIISFPEFNRFLFSFFPRLLLESGQASIGGVMFKAIIGTLLFTILALFI